MRSSGQVLFFIAAFILLSMAAPGMLPASDIPIIVNNATNAACSTAAAPVCFRTIQEAIDYANNVITTNTGTTLTYSIRVEPGSYSETITLKPGVSIVQGRETAGTILRNNGSAPIFTASNLSSAVSLRNFSFLNTATGILVSNSPSVINITNNVFYGTSGAAVTIQSSPTTNVINNTFFQNGTAVVRDAASIQIVNNIFSHNTVNISQNGAASTTQNNITYNDFNPVPGPGDITGSSFIPNPTITNLTNPDPLFVDTNASHLDVHLKSGSPCINYGDPTQGTPNDLGAYGGTNADTIPMQVSNVAATASSASIAMTWNANLSYSVTGYRIYYGNSPGTYNGVGAAEGPSPISMPSITTTSTMLSGLSTTVVTPANPHLNKPTALNESLALSWDAVPGATRYRVYYGISSPPATPVDVNATTHTLSGLTNGQTYYIAVSAIAEPVYYIAITAFDSTGQTKTVDIIPGIAHESAYSAEVPVSFGSAMESGLSNIESDFPEAIIPYPNLQNKRQGCFIATAAYGYYSAPEVRALREFRDRYLLTNSAGSAFVRWYYEHGPAAAAWLDAHPGCKPAVRTALMPAVGLALFMTSTSIFVKTLVALFLLATSLMTTFLIWRKVFSNTGGDQ